MATFVVLLDDTGTITAAPPIARWSIGQRFTVIHERARQRDRQARFAWLYDDRPAGEIWS